MFFANCIISSMFLVAAAVEFTSKGCGTEDQYEVEEFATHVSFTSTQPRCRFLSDLTIPWLVEYTIKLRLQSKAGSSPGVFFNVRDDFNYEFVFFRTRDYECVRPGYVLGNTLSAHRGYSRTCAHRISEEAWFDIAINVTHGGFSVSVDNGSPLSFPTGHGILAPTFGLMQGVGYEFECGDNCQINADGLSILPKSAKFNESRDSNGHLRLHGIPQNEISVFRIYFDELDQPTGTYCYISFYFDELDIGVGELSIEQTTEFSVGALETYETRNPYIDVLFNSLLIASEQSGFTIVYMVLKCGIANDAGLAFLCTRGNHIDLFDDFFRSTRNTLDNGHDDSALQYGWYRFSSCAGDSIPTTSPGTEGVCGTQYPIWMKDDEGKVCLYKDGAECKNNWKVHTYMCPDFKLYFLTPTPNNSGYCAGTKEKCYASQNMTSVDGSGCGPCVVGEIPRMASVPTINPWQAVNDGHNLPCEINGPENPGTEVQYHVEWLVDFGTHRDVITETNPIITDTVYNMHSKFLRKEYLQNKVLCRVKANYKGMAAGDWLESEPFFIGIKVLNPPTSEISFDTFFLETEITAPLSSTGETNCGINVIFATTMDGLIRQDQCDNVLYVQPELIHRQKCVHDIECSKWEPGQKLFHALSVKNTDQQFREGFNSFKYTLYIVTKADDRSIWNNIVTKVEIPVMRPARTSGKSCSSNNDPHLTTFKKRLYDVHLEGEYVMYKSTPINDRDMQVLITAKFDKCSTSSSSIVYCNSAVGIRVKDEAIVIDYKERPTHRYIGDGFGEEGFRLSVSESKRLYTVYLPRGETVQVTVNPGYYLYFHVHSLLEEQDNLDGNGLCGRISAAIGPDVELILPNGDNYVISNEITVDFKLFGRFEVLNGFGTSWRASPNDQIISNDSLPKQNTPQKDAVYTCKVKDASVVLSAPATYADYEQQTFDVESCFIKREKTQYLMKQLRMEARSKTKRKKRETTKTHTHTNRIRSKRNKEVTWTEESAREFCYNYIVDTPTGNACNKTDPEEVTTAYEQCILDILLMQTTEWAKGTLNSLRELCIFTLYKRLDLWTFAENATYDSNATSSDNVTLPSLVPPAYIIDDLCPQDCSGNGICVDGLCQCNAGYIETDCSVDIETPPMLTEVMDGDICYTTEECEALLIVGDNFVQSDDLTCHFTIRKQSGVDSASNDVNINMVGSLISYDMISCEWPQIKRITEYTTLSVSVSNDGVHVSEDMTGLAAVHYSCYTCETVDGEIECYLQGGWCLIDEECINNFENATENECLYCDPVRDTHAWTQNTGPECVRDNVPTTIIANVTNGRSILPWHIIVIVVCCLAVVAIALGLAMMLIRWRTKATSKKYDVTTENDWTTEHENVEKW